MRGSWWFFVVLAAVAHGVSTERVSVSSTGHQGGGASFSPSVSADGRLVTFLSLASDLVPDDTNGIRDVFVRDRDTGVTARVNVSSLGEEANDESGEPAISGDGRHAAFTSRASNLVPNDTNGTWDVFVHDRTTGVTERVSVSSAGAQGNGFSMGPSLSHDGRYVCFMSLANDLVPDDTNGVKDIFVHDRLSGVTDRVSISSQGAQANGQTTIGVISPDGRYVAMISYASNLVPGDTNGYSDAFLHDRLTGVTLRVGAGNGWTRDVDVSLAGLVVAFESDASDLVPGDTNGRSDIFVWDAASGQIERVSVSDWGTELTGPSAVPSVSADGRIVAFWSNAADAVTGDTNGETDLFARDRLAGRTHRVSVSSAGDEGNGPSLGPSCSADGSVVAFQSTASNLVEGDTNGVSDVFARVPAGRATISGAVDFGLPTGSVGPSEVVFRLGYAGWSHPYSEATVLLGENAVYSLQAPRGLLVVSAKPSHWLRRSIVVDTTDGDRSGVMFVLSNGDAVPDNRVDLLDLNAVLASFGGSGPSDLDESGQVGLSDLNIVLLAFGQEGDP
ncbi:MAG: PD40 domain-containing protein [Fimbriimonadia bacterium]|jgi:Tol biopolymer transport system component